MKPILFLAPQPFYQERGTPIAIDLTIKALESAGYEIDLVTYPEGEPRSFQRVTHHRVMQIPGINNVPPGFSWKKLVYSFLMIFTALRLTFTRRYSMVHAVEEACFIALLLQIVRRLPYVYDIDSSIAQQLVEKKPSLRIFSALLNSLEGLTARHATAVVAVCPALVDLAREYGAKNLLLLQDISLLDRFQAGNEITNLRDAFPSDAPLMLYVGNLEHYQGIDLLLEGIALAREKGDEILLAVIGGRPDDVRDYMAKAENLGISKEAIFFGPRPVSDLGAYLEQADILASPRTHGNNTPMKIYTYLDAGKAILATRIQSHTQALDDQVACLIEPTPQGIANGIEKLVTDQPYRLELGRAGHQRAVDRHSWTVYQELLTDFYNTLFSVQIDDKLLS